MEEARTEVEQLRAKTVGTPLTGGPSTSQGTTAASPPTATQEDLATEALAAIETIEDRLQRLEIKFEDWEAKIASARGAFYRRLRDDPPEEKAPTDPFMGQAAIPAGRPWP